MKKYCIYYHKSIDGKYYIGQTCQEVEQRWRKGSGYNTKKFNKGIIKEYGGWDSFEHGILEFDIPEEEIDKKEAYYINLYDSVENGFNTYKQNYNGYHFADLWANKDIKKDIINKLVEQRNTLEYKEKQSKIMKEIWQREDYKKNKKNLGQKREEKKFLKIQSKIGKIKNIEKKFLKQFPKIKKEIGKMKNIERKNANKYGALKLDKFLKA